MRRDHAQACASVGRVTPGTSQSVTLSAGRHKVPLTRDGHDRPYLLHVPSIARPDGAAFVLQLHGRGIDPIMFERWTGFSALADETGFVLAMPSAAGEA
jgi:poly(3-hydroxybutyrate) depolymerase